MSRNVGLSKDRGRKRHITGFYIETLILVAVLTGVILVLTRIFAFSGELSGRAGRLNRAVHLAENAAEAVAASDSLDMLCALLEENGNAEMSREEKEGMLQVWYDAEVSWIPEAASGGGFVESTVAVYWMEEADPLYMVDTAVYLGEAEVD